ncbi:MAG: galactokinase [Saprospiraceae bacterium]
MELIMSQAAEKALQRYRQKYSADPELICAAPGRINLIGEHTDYNEGFALPMAIDLKVWFAVGRQDAPQLSAHALDIDESVDMPFAALHTPPSTPWAAYLGGILRVWRDEGLAQGCGIRTCFASEIPIGAGLSSSAALGVGFIVGLSALWQTPLERLRMAQMVRLSENRYVGAQCGIMDMYASLHAHTDCALLLDCRHLTHEPVLIPTAGSQFILADTGVKHALANSEYNIRRRECAEAIALLQTLHPHAHTLRDLSAAQVQAQRTLLGETLHRRSLYVCSENERTLAFARLLGEGKCEEAGALMALTHAGLRDDYAVSCPEADFLVAQAWELPGCIGARMMGGGFGGCTLNWVKDQSAEQFREALCARFENAFGRPTRTITVRSGSPASVQYL